MPASEARIAANRRNALKSTGPQTPEGKQQSRANAYKHGMAGAGVVVPELEAAEVQRRFVAFVGDLKPSGQLGEALILRAATLSVRMERCVKHENAALTDRVRRAILEFVPPEGVDPAEAARLRAEAGTLALFDPSPEATLARRYESSAERGFFRALKEFRQVERDAKADRDESVDRQMEDVLASFRNRAEPLDELDRLRPESGPKAPRNAPIPTDPAFPPGFGRAADVPFSVGRRR